MKQILIYWHKKIKILIQKILITDSNIKKKHNFDGYNCQTM